MKTLTRRLFVAAGVALFGCVLTAHPLNAQDATTAKDVIDLHIKSFGGRDKLEAVKTVKTTAIMSMATPGGDMEIEVIQLQAGKKFLMVMEIPGLGEIKQGSDGEHHWMINPQTGAKLMDESESAAIEAQYSQPFPCLSWNDFDGEVKLAGTEKVDDADCYKLVFKPESGEAIERCFSKKDGRLLKMKTKQTSPMGEMEISVYPADYKEVNGITIPFKQVTEMSFGEMTMEIDDVKYNAKIKDSKFNLPKEIQDLVDGK